MNPFSGIAQVVMPGNIFNTQYGPKCHIKVKLDDQEWYQIPFVKQEKIPAYVVGMQLTGLFEFEQNGEYTNRVIDAKSLNQSGAPVQQQQQMQQPAAQPMQQAYQAPVQQPQVAQQAVQQPVAPTVQPQVQAPVKPPYKPGGGNMGARVGNAINNASAILGPGATLEDLERTAFAILEIASRLEKGTVAG